jgi:hypothetical protein
MKNLLTKFIQIVVFLFAAFGGFLGNAAPPAQTNPKFAVGLASFLTLIILLIISAVGKNSWTVKARNKWLVAGVGFFVLAAVTGVLYPRTLDKLTYVYPPPPDEPVAWHVNGWEYTETAKDFIKQNPGNWTPGTLELQLPYEDIWTADSVSNAKLLLLLNYIGLVLSIASAIFCLLEANLKRPQAARKNRVAGAAATHKP